MAETLGVLGQAAPLATVQTDLYTVAPAEAAVVSTLVACNTNTGPAKFRVRVRVNGAADHDKQFLAYDATVLGRDMVTMTLGIALAAGDVVSVQSDIGGVAFQAFGVRVS